jgi:hypothetical protein
LDEKRSKPQNYFYCKERTFAKDVKLAGEFCDEDVYSDDFGEDLDDFNDAELLDGEVDEGSK